MSSNKFDGTNIQINSGDLKKILAVSTGLTTEGENSNVGQLDEDKKELFYNAIESIQNDFQDDIEVVKQCLAVLRTQTQNADNCKRAMEEITELVDHIDVATNFAKLSGFEVVGEFLRSNNNDLVRLSADIIGIATQNHPLCQQCVIKNEKIFSDLFSILESTQYTDNVKTKAVFAVSSSIQNNKQGHDKFVQLDGYKILIQILNTTAADSLRQRVCFVINCLCTQFPQIKSILLENGYIECLMSALNNIPIGESKETVLDSLYTFIEGFYDALQECHKENYNLKVLLKNLLNSYNGNEDFAEEKEKVIMIQRELEKFRKKKLV